MVHRKKRKEIFKSNTNHELDKAELAMYEEVTLMKPFRRKTLVLIGASGVARRSLKQKILNYDPDQFASPLPHTSRPKRSEEDSGMRYWFVDREDMEYDGVEDWGVWCWGSKRYGARGECDHFPPSTGVNILEDSGGPDI